MSERLKVVQIWRIIFWILFFLNWILIPFMQYYYESGHLSVKKKLRESIVMNLLFYAVILVIGIAFFIYLHIEKKLGVENIEVLVISLSNCFGLILVFLFLAPGLVEVPLSLWRIKNLKRLQESHEAEVGYLSSNQDEIFYELENQVKILYNISKSEAAKEYKEDLMKVIEFVPSKIIEAFPTSLDSYCPQELFEKDISNLSESYIAGKNLLIRGLLQKYDRAFSKIEDSQQLCLLLNNFTLASGEGDEEDRVKPTILQRMYYKSIRPMILHCALLVCLFLSISLIIGQFILFKGLNIEKMFHKSLEKMNYVVQLGMFWTPFFYMILCIYKTLFGLELEGFYGLYKKHTDDASLLFYTL